jgi:hypothetical protein
MKPPRRIKPQKTRNVVMQVMSVKRIRRMGGDLSCTTWEISRELTKEISVKSYLDVF